MRIRPSGVSAVLAAAAACSTPPRTAAWTSPPAVDRAAPVVGASAGPARSAAVAYGSLAGGDAPLALTTDDGNGLRFDQLDAKVVIEGPLAFTELHLRFHNPEARRREGRFQITLPPGAAVSRFAMRTDGGRWMEAEMVERAQARRAYEDFLHRRTDPALLEKQPGNQFSARVFPIPASGDKDLIVSYSQELPRAGAPYVLPLHGLPRIGEVSASARVLRADRAAPAWDETTLREKAWQPDRDFAVTATGPEAIASGDLVAVRITPELGVGAAPMQHATILFDTSGSRALGYDQAVSQLGALIAQLDRAQPGLRVTVAAFDQEVAPIYDGPAAGFGAADRARLVDRAALGASDPGAALAWARAHGAHDRVVLITDGVATAGSTEAAELGKDVAALGPAVRRLDVVLVGGIRDRDAAAALARGHLAADGAVLDGDAGSPEIARRLGLATRSEVAVAVDGATWTWPARLDGVQPGDSAVVFAQLGAKAARSARVIATVGGRRVTLTPAGVPRPLVERAAARAEVAGLEAARAASSDARARAALSDRIVKLSIAERVLSDDTALLVLETDADYARYGLDRKALADILAVGPDGLVLEHRAAPVVIAQPEPPATGAKGKDEQKEANKASSIDMKKLETEQEVTGDDDGAPDRDVGGAVEHAENQRGLVDRAPTARPEAPPADIVAVDPAPGPGGDGSPPPAPPPPPPAERALRVRAAPSSSTVRLDGHAHAPVQNVPAGRHEVVVNGEGYAAGSAAATGRPLADHDAVPDQRDAVDPDDDPSIAPPAWTGDFRTVMDTLRGRHPVAALTAARAWHGRSPGDVLALVALGETASATGDRVTAARAYGSIIDLFPGRADLRRFAGERLEHLDGADDATRALVLDTYRRAEADRPDHLTGHRLYAYALVRAGRWADAAAALERGLDQSYPSGRFAGGERVLREDLGIVGAAWAQAEPGKRAEIARRLARHGATIHHGRTLRFILYWETDDNDVDFHIRDARGNHAFYKHMQLASGGALYADITTGYGPECFAIDGKPTAGPYHLLIHYFSRGPMGYGMGTLEVLDQDAKGRLRFEHRPFIVMNDKAFVDLGTVTPGKVGGGATIAR
jgi:Vault protein inter-alpha-trypsin domain